MKPPGRILITGANGFIGSALTQALLNAGLHVRMASRTRPENLEALGTGAEWFPLPDLSGPVEWAAALEGMDAVVHLAGMAHRFESEVASDWGLAPAFVRHKGP